MFGASYGHLLGGLFGRAAGAAGTPFGLAAGGTFGLGAGVWDHGQDGILKRRRLPLVCTRSLHSLLSESLSREDVRLMLGPSLKPAHQTTHKQLGGGVFVLKIMLVLPTVPSRSISPLVLLREDLHVWQILLGVSMVGAVAH